MAVYFAKGIIGCGYFFLSHVAQRDAIIAVEVQMIESNLLVSSLLAGFFLLLGSALLIIRRRRRFSLRRDELLSSEMDPQWEAGLEENFPLYRKMPGDIRRRLGGYVNAFIEEKSFEGCGGLGKLTDEMLVTVAGQACILLLNGRFGVFDSLHSVLLYPNAYDVLDSRDRSGLGKAKSRRLGESWESGSVVLSWAHVVSGPACPNDGRNLVIHEFVFEY